MATDTEEENPRYFDQRKLKARVLAGSITDFTASKVREFISAEVADTNVPDNEALKNIQRGMDFYDQIIRAVQEVNGY